MRWEKITLRAYLLFFFGTYVVVQVITFTECYPFDHYWIVLPDPGASSALSDHSLPELMMLPLPQEAVLRRRFSLSLSAFSALSRMLCSLCCQSPFSSSGSALGNCEYNVPQQQAPVAYGLVSAQRKLQLYALFLFGIFIVAITVVRLPQNWNNATAQVNRTTWASAELLASAIVANAPMLYILNKRRREPLLSGTKGSSRYPANSYPTDDSNVHSKPKDDEFELISAGRDVKASDPPSQF